MIYKRARGPAVFTMVVIQQQVLLWYRYDMNIYVYADIGINLTDPMFRGVYRGTQKHEGNMKAHYDRLIISFSSWMLMSY